MATLYIGRDNTVVLTLQKSGATVAASVVTRAQFWLPGEAAVDGNPVVYDTATDNDISLTNVATKVEITAGNRQLKAGRYLGYLTIYDAVNTDGIAWATVPVSINGWNP